MDIETLRYFQYIAKYKNVTRAAKHFYISQSTLSRNMMALEKELNVTLFIRDNKKLELTEAGNVFSKECDLFIKHMERIIHNTQSAEKGTVGVLRIVIPNSLNKLLYQPIHLFKEKYPDIQLIIESYDFNEITSAILYDIYDIGFTYDFSIPTSDNINCSFVAEDDFSLVVSSEIFKESSKEAIASIIKSYPLILPSYSEPPFIKSVLHELQNYAGGETIKPTYVNTTESVILQASLGLGYSIVPTSFTTAISNEDNITYYPLDEFSAKSQIVMLYKKPESSKIIASFVKLVNTLVKSREWDFLEHLS
ncbi:LysR family transcriptional regulator [Alloiococcus sp. CFN-8]|uniref:LysR family transcriptional regulator n=1 Tax=Alloiococcus sp. CFN-8 TaxID=3416081 RepID=UPI003CF974E9